MTIHDEGGMRHFYAEWGRRMGRSASDPYGEQARPRSERLMDVRTRISGWSTAPACCSTTGTSRPTSPSATSATNTNHDVQPEIRKPLTWLAHDKAGLATLFGNPPRHNSDSSPLTRHVTVYTVARSPRTASVRRS